MRLVLQFSAEQSPVHRARLEYAFRVFCAIYGHQPILGCEDGDNTTITYARNGHSRNAVTLTNAYSLRAADQTAPEPLPYSDDNDDTVLFYRPSPPLPPDWLAEIFEWLSCADEYSIRNYDSVGRVPFSASYVGRHRLNPFRPYAAIAMRFLQAAIRAVNPACEPQPLSPMQSARHFVVNTHDVDFLPVQRISSCHRLAKNAALSFLLHKAFATSLAQAKGAAAVLFGGCDPLDQIRSLVTEEEKRRVTASYYFLCRHAHRRDGNYSIAAPATIALLRELQPSMELGVHGSYRSGDDPDGLAHEFDRFRHLGFDPIGGRQHWLRFTVARLIQAVQRAGAIYDASLGWSEQAGFRAGACFPFPPYDFEREKAATFLEIPLVLMDRAVAERHSHNGHSDPGAEVLAASRRHGWGGISVLWHPTAFGSGQYPAFVGKTFWELLDQGLAGNETWLSAASFVQKIWHRYVDAGLLPDRRLQ